MTVFDFSTYRTYLRAALEAPGKRSGIKARVAEAMDSQPAFLSRVLVGQASLSLEQADKVSHFLGHTADEHHFFLLLLQHERAGSVRLKAYFRKQIEEEKNKRKSVSKQIQAKTGLSEKAESRYYSSWVFAAVHTLLSIEDLQTPEALASALNLPVALIQEVLRFLVEHGLAEAKGSQYKTGFIYVHLKADSDQILRHHSNWRLKSLERLNQPIDGDVRYSGVVTLDEECVARIRESLVENLKRNLSLIEAAPARTAYVLNVDFFRLCK
jgi:uncharacterized protein (TIGR02147 family)